MTPRPRTVLICLAALALNACPTPRALAAPAPVPHVIQLSVDGLSAVYLRQALTSNPAAYPTFTRLLQEGAATLNARCDADYSETVPNHACMVTGQPVLQPQGWKSGSHHGYTDNDWDGELTFHITANTDSGYLPGVFDVAHDFGLSTAFFAAKRKLAICYFTYNETNGAPDLLDDDNGRNKVDHAEILDWGPYDRWDLLQTVTNYLADTAPNLTFLHIADLDYTGHTYGWGSTRWFAVLRDIDSFLGSLLDTLDRSPEMAGQTSIIITADHGGGYPSSTHVYPLHVLNYTIPFIIWGPGWPGGTDAYAHFVNRFDPGTNHIVYTAAQQPLRNGDSPNLALRLLGLPAIPESALIPLPAPKVTLAATLGPCGIIVSWPSDSPGYLLETSANLQTGATWTPIVTGILDDGLHKSWQTPCSTNAAAQFYRLRLVD